MEIDRFIEPIFAYCAHHYGCLSDYHTQYDFKKIYDNSKSLAKHGIYIYNYCIDCVVLIDLEQIIKLLAYFREAITQLDPSFGDTDFEKGWSVVYSYYSKMEELYKERERMAQLYGYINPLDHIAFTNKMNNYEFKQLIESVENIARQYLIESRGLFSRMYKRHYRKQAEKIVEWIGYNKDLKPKNIVSCSLYW